jgi:N-acetyl sugar amidotransferase
MKAFLEKKNRIMSGEIRICTRCIYDETVPNITFDEKGICNYCYQIDDMERIYHTGTTQAKQNLQKMIEQVKKDGKGKKYDCVIGVSGGTDSSYLVHKMVKEWGLRPLAVHYDSTWNTGISTENIRKMLSKLNVDLYTHVVDNKEMDEIYKAFFKSDVPEIEAPYDLGVIETLYRACKKYKVKYLFEGHSFQTEGISPLGSMYFDGGYIQDIVSKFSKIKFKTYPLMTFWAFLKWILVYRIKRIRPFWYETYTKEDAQQFLMKEYNWEYYGGHHLENRMTAFFHSYYLPHKFDLDQRNNSLSALVRRGILDRQEAINRYCSPPTLESEILSYLKKRLGFSDDDFEVVMARKPKYWFNYYTYKRRFEALAPLFFIFAKAELVPMSFYIKYCRKNSSQQ